MLRPLLNYTDFSLDAVREMLLHPTSAWGLGDGGAHCGTTCDASTPTFMLTHWARDRDHDRLPLEWVVQQDDGRDRVALRPRRSRRARARASSATSTSSTSTACSCRAPEMVHDLPGDARRFVQGSEGYVATVKRGVTVLRDGEDQGARPGQLVRGVAPSSK